MLQNLYFESFSVLKPLMTTPLSWVGNTLLRYGGSNEHIGFDWVNHQITIGNYRDKSGSDVPYNEIVLGRVTDGAGLEIVSVDNDSATICAGGDNASIMLSVDTTSTFSIDVGKTSGSFSFGFTKGDGSTHLPIEASVSNSSVYVTFSAANQKDDEQHNVHLEISNQGIHMPLLWKTNATNSTKIQNIDYLIQFYDAEFLSLTDNSSPSDSGSRNFDLAQTIPSTYAVRSAINNMVAPFSFVAKTDANNNDFFGVKFTDPANPEITKTLWFNFATVDGENVGIGEWENATTRKSTTP